MSYDVVFRYRQDTDPSTEDGFSGPGTYWVDSSSEPYIIYLRNEADTDWIELGSPGTGISGIIIKGDNSTVDSDVTTLDFALDEFSLTESPENEINITLAQTYALDPHTHVHTEVTDFTEAVQDVSGGFISGDSMYISTNYVDGSNALLIEHTGNHDDRYYTQSEVDTLLSALFIDPEFTGRIDTNGSGASFAALTAAGTTASVASSTGNDIAGIIQLVPGGTGIASGSQVEVTFSNARPDTDYMVFFQEVSTGALTLGEVGPISRTTTTFRLRLNSAPTSGTTYQWFYLVVGY